MMLSENGHPFFFVSPCPVFEVKLAAPSKPISRWSDGSLAFFLKVDVGDYTAPYHIKSYEYYNLIWDIIIPKYP